MSGALASVVAVLAAVVVLLIQLIIIVRAVAIRRSRRERRLRPAAELSLAEYLAGSETTPAPAGRDERAVLLTVALDALADVRGSEHARLVALLDQLGYVDEAMSQLRSRRRIVRQRAAETLAAFASPSTVPALRDALGDRDVLVRLTCARTLADLAADTLGPEIVAAAKRDMSAAPGAAAAVVLALGTTRPADLAPLLAPGAPAKVRATAIAVAGALRLSGLAPQLRAGLHDTDGIAASAAEGLGRIGDIEAVGELSQLALDHDRAPATRSAALTALGAIGDPSALGVLVQQLASQDWSLLAAATRALARLGEPGEAVLRQAASASRPELSELALAVLQR